MDATQAPNKSSSLYPPKESMPGMVRYTAKLTHFHTKIEMSVVEYVDESFLRMATHLDEIERNIKENLTSKLVLCYLKKNASPTLGKILMGNLGLLLQMLCMSGYMIRIERED